MSFLIELFVFLAAAIVVVPICKRLGLSSVIGYLVAGLAIGPAVIGLVDDAVEVLHFAEVGVVLLLFVIGLELQVNRLLVMRRAVFLLGSLQLLLTTVAITGLLLLLFSLPMVSAALLGISLALSSTAFVLQLLGEQKKLNHAHGRAAFGVLLLQDIAVIPVIAIVSLSAPSSHGAGLNPVVIAAVVLGMVAARFSLRPLLRFVASTGIHELFIAASLAIVTGSALAMQYAGLSMGLGAFIAGMMVADSEYRHQLETDVMPFKGLLLGLFFMAVGMSANLALLQEEPLLIVGLALGLVAVKLLVLWPVALWYGLDKADSLRTAAVLSQGGEFAFVILTAALSAALIESRVVEIAVLVVTLSMVTTPFLGSLIERLLVDEADTRPFDEISTDANPVVIAGFGRFGQIIARVLGMKGISFTALDVSPGQVDFVRQFGNEIYYGDATRLDLLKSARLAEAKVLVIATDDPEASLKLAELARECFPGLHIMARARNRQHELQLRETGVHDVVRETLHSSLALTHDLLEQLGYPAEVAKKSVGLFREHDERTLNAQLAVYHDEEAFRQSTQDAAEELRQLFRADQQGEPEA